MTRCVPPRDGTQCVTIRAVPPPTSQDYVPCMDSLSWLAALALLAAPPDKPANPDPARESVPPTQRAEDRPAHESPYSAFGAPHAKRPQAKKRAGARLLCADGTTQTQRPRAKNACEDHGGVKAKSAR